MIYFYFSISALWYCSAILRFSENDSFWIAGFSIGTLYLVKGILEKKRKDNANNNETKDKKE